MDDYPVADIYDYDIVDNYCQCGTCVPECDQELPLQERRCPKSKVSARKEFSQNYARSCTTKRNLKTRLPTDAKKEKAILKKLGITETEEEEEAAADQCKTLNDCCAYHEVSNEDNTPRKFLLTFDNRLDECSVSEKTFCKAFWEFIDSEELMQNLIRDGEFVYENPPQRVQAITPSTSRKVRSNKDHIKLRFEEQEARNRAVHEDEQRRRQKQRERSQQLQLKSGQKLFVRGGGTNTKASTRKEKIYADCCNPSIDEVLNEMKIFDKLLLKPNLTAYTEEPHYEEISQNI